MEKGEVLQKMKYMITAILALLFGFGLAYFVIPSADQENTAKNDGMGQVEMNGDGMSKDGMDDEMMYNPDIMAPAVKGFSQGEEIYFLHTEVSDEKIAKILEGMMGSPVPVVSSLTKVPEEALTDVYVFDNGIEGMGPLGFQPDIMVNPPETEGYRPLRKLNIVTWEDEKSARILKSASELEEAKEAGEVTIKETEIVINMPMLTWPGGQR
jgi:hypothetical protein